MDLATEWIDSMAWMDSVCQTNLRTKIKGLEPWNRPINETKYNTDDLTVICMCASMIVELLGDTSSFRPTAVHHWFRTFTPGEASHTVTRRQFPNAKGALVKINRLSTSHCPVYSTCRSDVEWLFDNEAGSSRCFGVLMPVVRPTVKYFENVVGAVETLCLAEYQVPPQLAEQIMYRVIQASVGRRGIGRYGHYVDPSYTLGNTSVRLDEAVSMLAKAIPLRFRARGTDSDKANTHRLKMGVLLRRRHNREVVLDQKKKYLDRALSEVSNCMKRYYEATDELVEYQQIIAQEIGRCPKS